MFAGAAVLSVMLAGMFTTEVALPTVLGTAVFVLNAALLLRLPVHSWVRTLSRQKALMIASFVHLAEFGIMSTGATDVDMAIPIFANYESVQLWRPT